MSKLISLNKMQFVRRNTNKTYAFQFNGVLSEVPDFLLNDILIQPKAADYHGAAEDVEFYLYTDDRKSPRRVLRVGDWIARHDVGTCYTTEVIPNTEFFKRFMKLD